METTTSYKLQYWTQRNDWWVQEEKQLEWVSLDEFIVLHTETSKQNR